MEAYVKDLLKQKDEFWNTDKTAAYENISDLSDLFSEKTTFKKIKPNKKYSEWFGAMAEKINVLDSEEVSKSSKKIQEYSRAL